MFCVFITCVFIIRSKQKTKRAIYFECFFVTSPASLNVSCWLLQASRPPLDQEFLKEEDLISGLFIMIITALVPRALFHLSFLFFSFSSLLPHLFLILTIA